MAGYTDSEMDLMRRDAIRRMQEMYNRTQGYINMQNRQGMQSEEKPSSPQQSHAQTAAQNRVSGSQQQVRQTPHQQSSRSSGMPHAPNPEMGMGGPFQRQPFFNLPFQNPMGGDGSKGLLSGLLDGIFPDLKLDEEKLIIIFLLIILARNGADMKLLLALGYLLM